MSQEDNEPLNDADVFGEVFRCFLCKMELSSNIASRLKHQKECASKNKIGKRKIAKLKRESLERQKRSQKKSPNKSIPKLLKIDPETIIIKSDNASNEINEKKRNYPEDVVIKKDPLKKFKQAESPVKLINDEDLSRNNNNSKANSPIKNTNLVSPGVDELSIDIKTDDNILNGVRCIDNERKDDAVNNRDTKSTSSNSTLEIELLELLKSYKEKFDKLKAKYDEQKEALQKHYYMEIGKLTLEKEEKIELLKKQFDNLSDIDIKKEEEIKKDPILNNDLMSNAFNSTVNIHWDGNPSDFDFIFPESQELKEDSESDLDEFFSPVFPIGSNVNDSESSDNEKEEPVKENLIVKIPHTKDIDKKLSDRVSRKHKSIEKTTIEYIHEIDDDNLKNERRIKEVFQDIDESLTPNIDNNEIIQPSSPKTSAIDDLLQKYEFKR